MNGDNNGNNCYTIKANNLTLDGTLRAHSGCIIVIIAGNFLSEINGSGVGTVDVSGVTDSDTAAEFELTASGSVTLNGTKIDATGATGGHQGGDIVITGTTVTGSTAIHADATTGNGGNYGGTVSVATTATTNGDFNIDLTGNISVNAAGTTSANNGGTITMDAKGGLTVGTSSHDLEAKGTGAGFGGDISLTAEGGTATINGALNVNCGGATGFIPEGGSIEVAGNSISTGTAWTAAATDANGWGGSITATAKPAGSAGTITTTSASSFSVEGGTGGLGGSIDVEASGSITLAGDMNAQAAGLADGGDIKIAAGVTSSSTLTIQSTATFHADVTGTTGFEDGTIELSGCNVTIAGDADTRNTSTSNPGQNTVTYQGAFTTNSGSSLLADNVSGGKGGNLVHCRCVDNNHDGVCDTPVSCVSSPSFSGTVTPSATISPTAQAACS
ncbi:MAG: hypothetical protein ACHQ4J_02400 [Candidatus Binatia bacterium]